jgi:hypothetical protein
MEQLSHLREDPDWRVRHCLASRLSAEDVGALLNDSDPVVAETARRRVSGELNS